MPSTGEVTDHWHERVSDVPASWFDALVCSPRHVPLADWSFAAAEKEELAADAALRGAVAELLHTRAEIRWLNLPSPEEVAEWLSGDADPTLEAELGRLALARESARRQAWLRVGAGLLTREAAEMKLAHIGAVSSARAAWLTARIALTRIRGTVESLAESGAEIAAAFSGRELATGRGPNPTPEPRAPADLAARLMVDGRLTCFVKGGRLFFQLADDVLTLEAGRSSLDMLPAFAIEFHRAGEAIVCVETVTGKVTLTPEILAAAADADEVVIVTLA